jgi:HAD superfamily hydrolase (TIGR01549 family)
MTIFPENITRLIPTLRLFIFDLDGTLYDQPALRRRLSYHLFWKLVTFKIRLLDLKIIAAFRDEREKHKGYASPDLHEEQFAWCAKNLGITATRAKRTIEWAMYKNPLQFLPKVKYSGIDEVFRSIRTKGKCIAIFSDFPVEEKMDALQLKADRYFYSADSGICQLKPSAPALRYICSKMDCKPDEAILIGDRDDTDGESAREAGMNYLIIDTSEARKGNYFESLSQLINQL